MEFIKTLLGLSNIMNILVYIAIVAVFIVGLVYCIAPVLDNRGRLRKATRQIKQGEKSKYSWQQETFLGKGSLFSHWSAYLNNLFFAEDGMYHNASNVEDFINEETVIYGPGRSAFADAVPSLLVSLGFLGTLIGLADGLAGFNMENAAAAQESIMTLIPGMKYAFTTSIFGVIGSVGFTLITRAVYGSTEHTLRSFYGAMSRYAGVVSVDPLTQMAIYQQEQNDLLQIIAKDLNGKFTDNMAQIIHESVEPVNQSLKNFVTVTTKEQMRFLDAVVMRFVDRMDESIGGHLKNFGEVLDQTTRAQQETFTIVRASMLDSEAAVRDLRGVQQICQDMIETMNHYLNDLRNNQKQAEDAYLRMSSSVEQMELVSRQQTNYLKTVSAMQAEISRTVETMTGAVNSFTQRFAEENASASAAMQKAAADLRDAGTHIADCQRDATKAMEAELKETLDDYREYVDQFTKRVDYLAASISDSLNQMPQAVAETSDQFLDQVDRLTQALEQAQQMIAEAADRMYNR